MVIYFNLIYFNRVTYIWVIFIIPLSVADTSHYGVSYILFVNRFGIKS